nr:hypothetical protein [Bartonella sp. AU55XJBT]
MQKSLKHLLKSSERFKIFYGETRVMIFEKSSTRTNISFDISVHQLWRRYNLGS